LRVTFLSQARTIRVSGAYTLLLFAILLLLWYRITRPATTHVRVALRLFTSSLDVLTTAYESTSLLESSFRRPPNLLLALLPQPYDC